MAKYEITAPDGTKHEVTAPEDATEEQILAFAKSQFSQPQASPEPQTAWQKFANPKITPEQQAGIDKFKANPWGSGVPKFAYDRGGDATDLATKIGLPPSIAAGAGFATNFLTQAIPSMITSFKVPGGGGPVLESPASWLMQTAVKPSPADLKSGAAARAFSTMLDEGVYPTVSGMDKASKITGALDDQVTNAIAKSPANVSVAAIGSRLRDPYQKALTQMNPQDDLAAIRGAWDQFKTSPLVAGKTEIPVQLAQELKKGTYQALGGKSYGEVGSAAVEAQKALARGAREEVAKAVPEVVAPLARQAALMNVRDVAGNRALLEASKNPMGLAALRIGDNPLSSAAFMADRWAALKAFLAMQMYGASKPQVLAPFGAAGGALLMNQPRGALSVEE